MNTLKVQVKQITATEGSIPGTLLVTPTSIAFDPRPEYPLCRENGTDQYVLYAKVEQIASISLYREISALQGSAEEKKEHLYVPHQEDDKEDDTEADTANGSDLYEQNLATLRQLQNKTKEARFQAKSCTKIKKSDNDEMCPFTVLPYYMAVRILPLNGLSFEIGTIIFPENEKFWLAVPRNQIELIYHFLLEWLPEKYGQVGVFFIEHFVQETETISDNKSDISFVISDSSLDENLFEEQLVPSGNSSVLNKEWEFTSVSVLWGRLTQLSDQVQVDLFIPEGAISSKILDEAMIIQLSEILPARAQGYKWKMIFNTNRDGYHLLSLYRKMEEFGNSLSPILFIVKSSEGKVFGSIVSEIIRPCSRFQGTADSCLLWRFSGHFPVLHHYTHTGINDHFYFASQKYILFGAGTQGFGLYLNEDLSSGTSEFSDTFHNECLAGDKKDFDILSCEAFGFRD